MKRFYAWFMIFGSWCLWSCETCGVKSDPTLEVSFEDRRLLAFDKITVLGANKEMEKKANPPSSIVLPINLNANSTTYIFEQPTRRDTLTVFYDKRIFNANTTKCGYVLDLIKPSNGLTAKTTFKEVEVIYGGYYSNRSNYSAGIIVNIRP